MLTLRIDGELLARLKRQAKDEGRSVSAQVVRLLRRELGEPKLPTGRPRSAMGMFPELDVVGVGEVRTLRAERARGLAARVANKGLGT